jgi:predicted PhzF superfamily epimerase YddE/YHI9
MKIPIYQIDAFTSKLFSGNPAAVCPLESWLDDKTLLNLAAENNLSETAFFVEEEKGFRLRWFTPEAEIDLCGHATLAAAYVIFNELGHRGDAIAFQSLSGKLTVMREDGQLVLDFPSRAPVACLPPEKALESLGGNPMKILRSRDYFVVYNSEEEVSSLTPDFTSLAEWDALGVIVTAKGDRSDFVSRFFAPRAGVPEDPVTGSAHCTLIPYWAEELNKTKLHAYQISKRGGELFCEFRGDRVKIAGHAVKYLEGTLEI